MMKKKTRRSIWLVALLLGFAGVLCLDAAIGRAEDAGAPTPVRLTVDRPLESSMAPLIAASNRGLFAAERLTVRIDVAGGSPDAIARVASDASDFALVDINELIRFRSKADAAPVKAVFVLFNQSPYAIVARKSRGIRSLSDLAGKTIGVAEGDLSFYLWPALARQNGLKTSSMNIYRMSAAVREPILSAGQVDAVAGFSYLSGINLRDRGVPSDDLACCATTTMAARPTALRSSSTHPSPPRSRRRSGALCVRQYQAPISRSARQRPRSTMWSAAWRAATASWNWSACAP
jgi:NitT/TauT family transport system substrate-binding protein